MEELHAGIVPISKTGDFTDVKVIDGAGREIPWNELSRLDNDEMKKFMKQVVDRLYTYYVVGEDSDFQKSLGKWKAVAYQWDDPEIFNGFMSMRIKDNNA